MKFGLEDHIVEKITHILEEQPKVDKAYIFGSRAKDNYRPDSDIDVAVKGYDLTIEDMLKMSAAIDKLGIRYEVDLVDYGGINVEALREHVDRVGVLLYENEIEYSICDLAAISNEKRIPLNTMERRKRKGRHPYYGASGVVDYIDSYIFDGEYVLISEDGENLKSRQTPIAFIAKGKFWVNNHAHIVKGFKPFMNKLLVYYFENLDLNPYLTGAVQPKLNKAALLSIPIRLPRAESSQIEIVSILSTLDDKIDLLHRQNKTLESMAETLFIHWFIEGQKKDWPETRLEKHVIPHRGLSYKGAGLTDEDSGLPMHNLNSIYEGGGYKYGGIKHYKGESKKRHLVHPGDIIVANTEQGHEYKLIGFPAIVPEYYGPKGIFSQHIYKISLLPETYLTSEFIYYLLMTPSMREQIIGATNGSTVNMLALDGLQRPAFKLPPEEKVKEFSIIVGDYWLKKNNNYYKIQVLVNLRDTLLPKLLSGEARVKMS